MNSAIFLVWVLIGPRGETIGPPVANLEDCQRMQKAVWYVNHAPKCVQVNAVLPVVSTGPSFNRR